jgi:hypothetical protein
MSDYYLQNKPDLNKVYLFTTGFSPFAEREGTLAESMFPLGEAFTERKLSVIASRQPLHRRRGLRREHAGPLSADMCREAHKALGEGIFEKQKKARPAGHAATLAPPPPPAAAPSPPPLAPPPPPHHHAASPPPPPRRAAATTMSRHRHHHAASLPPPHRATAATTTSCHTYTERCTTLRRRQREREGGRARGGRGGGRCSPEAAATRSASPRRTSRRRSSRSAAVCSSRCAAAAPHPATAPHRR